MWCLVRIPSGPAISSRANSRVGEGSGSSLIATHHECRDNGGCKDLRPATFPRLGVGTNAGDPLGCSPSARRSRKGQQTSTVTDPDTFEHQTESRWAVETHGLTKQFGENVAVNNVELLVPRGCAFGYLGPNGAGKTTLIRVLLGLTHADAGTMSLLGYPVPKHRDLALARVGAIVDEPRFHGHLTGRQNLQILAAARGPGARDRIRPALERVGILHRADDKVSKYSMGMRQRLGVAACLIGDPQLLILDEPMNVSTRRAWPTCER